jgi:DNA-binding CsgD family transcriptional regulator
MLEAHRSDEDLLAHAALGLWAMDDLSEFRASVLSIMRELIPADIASYNEISREPPVAVVVGDPHDALGEITPQRRQRFAELIWQNPLAAHFARTGDTSAQRMSDFIARRALHRLELYDLFYRPIGTDYQIAFTVPAEGHLIGITLSRCTQDFEDRELALLQGVRALVIAAFRNLHDRARLDAILRASDSEEPGPWAVLLVEPSGLLTPAHDRAARLLRRLSTDPSTIDALGDWAALQRRERPRGSVALQLETSERELEAHYLHRTSGSLDAIAIRPRTSSQPQAFRALGLTPRQSEVLHLLWQGKANAEIGRALSISEHTVRHHLEDIYRQLGVKSRAGAAHAASRALSG